MFTDHRTIEALARDAFACHFDDSSRSHPASLLPLFAWLRTAVSTALTPSRSANS